MTATHEPFRPQIFGKFFLLQKLGAGGMAEIFRGKSAGAVGFEKELVIKRILPALSSDKQFVRMLVNEAKLTVALTHPTIAQVYELGEVEGQHFISMELVEGASLHDLMHVARNSKRPLTVEQSIYMCLEVLRGLEYAHKRTDGAGNPLGIVHCDVSPDNVMVTWDGGIKLLDFGVARAAQSSLSNYREGTLMGKLSYAAPEQAEGEWFDHRVDLFAVGVMFYELLTGTHPFGRVQTIEALRASRKKPVAPPSQVDPTLPSMLDPFVLRALAYRREDRFQSAKEMADELVDFLFPTPIIAVQEHVAASMKDLYRERIERQQRLRANDPLHMKVLINARKAQPQVPVEQEAQPAGLPEPDGTRIFVSALEPHIAGLSADGTHERTPTERLTPSRHYRVRRPMPVAPARSRSGWRSLVAGLGGLLAGAAATYGLLGQEGPVLVVLSEPPGAEVLHEGVALGRTPLVLDDAPVPAEGATITLRLDSYRDRSIELAGGRVLQAEAQLESSLGSFRIESEPAGAQILVDGEVIGRTPATLQDLPLDRPQRFDLRRRGYELDSFIVVPDEVEGRVVRQLVRAR